MDTTRLIRNRIRWSRKSMQAAEYDAMLRRERLAVKEVRSIPSGEPPFFFQK
jgi:hypothetical protein